MALTLYEIKILFLTVLRDFEDQNAKISNFNFPLEVLTLRDYPEYPVNSTVIATIQVEGFKGNHFGDFIQSRYETWLHWHYVNITMFQYWFCPLQYQVKLLTGKSFAQKWSLQCGKCRNMCVF